MSEEVNYNIGQLLEAINNKADLDGSNLDNTSFETFINSLVDAKLGNIDYVVESKLPTEEDPTWYRVYKSGWVEQGGVTEPLVNNTSNVINLIKSYSNTNFSVISQPILGSVSNDGGTCPSSFVMNNSNDSFTIYSGSYSNQAGNLTYRWEAKGQGA